MLKLRAVPSLLIVPLVVIAAALPLADNLALEPIRNFVAVEERRSKNYEY
jgi:hypothetical protein